MLDWFKKSISKTVAPSPPIPPPASHAEPTVAPPTDVQDTADVPDAVGPYRVLAPLGEGGFATVYVAERFDRPGQRFALKVLTELQSVDADTRERFKREIEIGLTLHHENICKMVDCGTDDRKRAPYLVMELLEGEVLSAYVERAAPLSVAEACGLMQQILYGLRTIHDNGIVHRDLKPDNIFVTRDGVVKIMDFGIARKADNQSLTRSSATIGTLDFVAPEQILDARKVDERSDLFNAGMIMYLMVTRAMPFDAKTFDQRIIRLMSGQKTPLSEHRQDLPPALVEWINRLLDSAPEKRYANATEALKELGRVTSA